MYLQTSYDKFRFYSKRFLIIFFWSSQEPFEKLREASFLPDYNDLWIYEFRIGYKSTVKQSI